MFLVWELVLDNQISSSSHGLGWKMVGNWSSLNRSQQMRKPSVDLEIRWDGPRHAFRLRLAAKFFQCFQKILWFLKKTKVLNTLLRLASEKTKVL